ncbi:MAG: polysaccharide deacetylase family protein [Candidatus Eisenbacteria bacterium]|uniref:Polysaccharide deacetylase family protein n=1 Tax=Eiseniibacteriota bacterium TaxID=2212470 RepID=A0A849SMJ0_UNCEI|nr:polysaccharide deacetylase family protein [Candidatus Eisenbacteria bacterium]
MKRPLATVSIDVDPVDLHLQGYGFMDLPPDALVYDRALPRLAELFTRHGIRATFFVVGRDAAANAARLRELEDAGHEIASHSMTHPMPFVRVAMSKLKGELKSSRAALEAVCRDPIIGFRAPNWDVSPRAHAPLVEAGYRYDASGFPSLLQVPVRLLLLAKSSDPRKTFRMRPWPWTLERLPFQWEINGQRLVQFPISTSPRLRFPIYHTTRYLIGDAAFVSHLDGFVRRGEPFFYPLHGVDALGLVEDSVDARLGRHPGLDKRLDYKLDLLSRSLAEIARRFECVPYRDLLERLPIA